MNGETPAAPAPHPFRIPDFRAYWVARLSLTLPTLLDTDLLVLHVTGASKLATLQRAACGGSALEMPVRALLAQRRVPLEIYHAP